MDGDKKYITQLSAQDLKEIAMAANTHSGEGVDVIPTNEGLEISIDRAWL